MTARPVKSGGRDPLTAAHATEPTGSEPDATPEAPALFQGTAAPLKFALWLLVILRIGLGLIAFLSLKLEPPGGGGGNWLNLIITGHDPWSIFLSAWQRWDALWYQQIAEHGYRAGDGTGAFFPLYPLLSRLVSYLVGGQMVVSELLVSSVAFCVALWLLYKIACPDTGAAAAQLAVLLVALFPTGFFLLVPYTESLFLAMTLAALYFARRDRPWISGAFGFAAGLTRTQGALLVLPLAFEHVRRRDEQGKRPGLALAAATLPAFGLIAFTLYQHLIVGEHRSSLSVQQEWGYQVVPPWEALSASWTHIVRLGDPIEALNLASLVGFTILALWGVRRLPIAYTLYALPHLGLLFAREMYFSPLMSVSRFALVLFPCFIVLATWLARRPALAYGWLAIGVILQAFLFQYFVHWGFVG